MSEDDGYVEGHVEEALARAGETDVHVLVASGRVLLTGTVATDERRDAIAAITTEVAGGRDVHNQVTVLNCHEPDGEERLP